MCTEADEYLSHFANIEPRLSEGHQDVLVRIRVRTRVCACVCGCMCACTCVGEHVCVQWCVCVPQCVCAHATVCLCACDSTYVYVNQTLIYNMQLIYCQVYTTRTHSHIHT